MRDDFAIYQPEPFGQNSTITDNVYANFVKHMRLNFKYGNIITFNCHNAQKLNHATYRVIPPPIIMFCRHGL